MYNIGHIFTINDGYLDIAKYCNDNGLRIKEIEPLNGEKRFQIIEPDLTHDPIVDNNQGIKIEVIYDSTSDDPNLNKGFQGGMIGGKNFTWTENYDSIRIYAKCVAAFGYLEIPKNNRPTDDFTLTATAAAGRIWYAWKGMLYQDQNKLSVGRGYVYTLDTNTGTITMTGAMQENFWVTRVEGIKYN